jgi:two-component system nitrate/nitrite response regulator NarL
MTVSLVLADAQPIVLEGLNSVLRREKNFRIVAQCTTSEQTLRAVRKRRPDVLVLDIHMSSKTGFDILREMIKAKLTTRSVVFTAALNDKQTREIIRLGASGVVLKDVQPKVLLQCIRKVQAGQKWFKRGFSVTAVQRSLRRETAARRAHRNLTHRQMQIARMVASGLRNKQISKRLSISEGTVQVHLHHIYKQLNLPHRLALALYARDTGLI